ncbi:unnamed protein product [Hyaloperonospora brassicae]|uniref:RxLR effector candidate protein n=1 Tax=Hyaloperonospora brassicae TaxID=162125 RepID=A0AAV0V0E6_HYABA|nr:unnamed protein product [Hyaloperonospora brassicae]
MFRTNDYDGTNEQFGPTCAMATANFGDPKEEARSEGDAIASLDKVVAGQLICCAMCALHRTRSDEQVFACWRSETESSRLLRSRSGKGGERTSTFDKHHMSTRPKTADEGARESSVYPHHKMAPLESPVPGSRNSENEDVVEFEHDGTPREPFPGSPCTPCTPEKVSNASSVREVNDETLDNWRLSSSLKDPRIGPAAQTSQRPGVENISWLPRRLLLKLVRNRFLTTKRCSDNL